MSRNGSVCDPVTYNIRHETHVQYCNVGSVSLAFYGSVGLRVPPVEGFSVNTFVQRYSADGSIGVFVITKISPVGD